MIFRLSSVAVALLAVVCTVSPAATIGSSLVSRTTLDYNTGGLFIYNVAFPNPGEVLDSWAFFNDNAASAGRQITPLLFEKTGGVTFQIAGVGTARTNLASGIQSHAFGLSSGSAVIGGANYYFGWRDGTAGGAADNGVIELDFGGGPGLYYYPTNPPTLFNAPVNAGDSFTFSTATTTSRTYSVQANTVVPEPATLVFVGAALLLLPLRRLRK
jgi:hypothetical protein